MKDGDDEKKLEKTHKSMKHVKRDLEMWVDRVGRT